MTTVRKEMSLVQRIVYGSIGFVSVSALVLTLWVILSFMLGMLWGIAESMFLFGRGLTLIVP